MITDHTMPGLQGAELAEELATLRPDLPAILMTGLNQLPDLSGSGHTSLRYVFREPIDFVELSHRMRQVLDKSEGPRRKRPGGSRCKGGAIRNPAGKRQWKAWEFERGCSPGKTPEVSVKIPRRILEQIPAAGNGGTASLSRYLSEKSPGESAFLPTV